MMMIATSKNDDAGETSHETTPRASGGLSAAKAKGSKRARPPLLGKPPTKSAGVQIPLFPVDASTRTIAIAEVLIDEEWNARKHYDPAALDSLAADIKERGLIHAVSVIPLVEGSPDWERGMRWRLIAGFRRAKAIKLAGLEHVRATIGTLEGATGAAGQRAAKLANLAENLGREDLTTYELAQQVGALEAEGLAIPKIAASLHKSPSYFFNLTRALKRLAPELLTQWEANHPRMSAKRAIELSTLPPAQQIERWKAISFLDVKADRLLESGPDRAGGGDGGDGGGRDTKPTARILHIAKDKIAELDLTPAAREFGQALLAWILGEAKAPRAFGRLDLKVARGRPRGATKKVDRPSNGKTKPAAKGKRGKRGGK